MARWPDVPDVYGWLSLSRHGAWRLHPQGRGWGSDGADAQSVEAEVPLHAGEAITNRQIIDFIGRNYAADEQGRWYFQNGPQRVYVRLDGAPWILRTDRDAQGEPLLRTHTGLHYGPVTHWWLDQDGHLYAQADAGAGLVSGRDMAEVIDALRTPEGRPLAELLQTGATAFPALRLGAAGPAEPGAPPADAAGPSATTSAPLGTIPPQRLEATLGFIRQPISNRRASGIIGKAAHA